MDVSGEVADLMVKESLQAGETAVKLTASAVKNVAALLAALAQADYKITGRASARKLTKDPAPSVVVTLKTEDIARFEQLAKKEYGILYVLAKPNGKIGSTVDIISTERYAAKLNAVMQAMGYPLPDQQTQGKEAASKEDGAKKAIPRAQQGKSSPERGNDSKVQTRTPDNPQPEGKPSVRGRLAALQAASKSMEKSAPIRQKEHTR